MKYSKSIYFICTIALVSNFAFSSFAHLEKAQCCFADEGCISLESITNTFNEDLSYELSLNSLGEIFLKGNLPFSATIKLRSKQNSNPKLKEFNFLAVNLSTFDKDVAAKVPKDKLEIEILIDGQKEKFSATVFASSQREMLKVSKALKDFQHKYTFEIGMQISKSTLEKIARSKSTEFLFNIGKRPLRMAIASPNLEKVQGYLKHAVFQFLNDSKTAKELGKFIPKLQCSKQKTAEIIWEGKKNA